MMLRTWDTLTGEPGMTLVPLLGERSSPDAPRRSAWFAVAPDGRVHGSANVVQELVYVIQTDKGQEALTPAEFAKRFGWKNEPQQVPNLTGSGKEPAATKK